MCGLEVAPATRAAAMDTPSPTSGTEAMATTARDRRSARGAFRWDFRLIVNPLLPCFCPWPICPCLSPHWPAHPPPHVPCRAEEPPSGRISALEALESEVGFADYML